MNVEQFFIFDYLYFILQGLVMFKKQSRDKNVKKLKSGGNFKRGRKNRENNKTKNKIAVTDSPFASLNVLLKN